MLQLFGLYLVFCVSHAVIHAFVGMAAGMRPSRIGLFLGPSFTLFKIRGVRFTLGLLPWGSFTVFDQRLVDGGSWESSRAKAILVILSAPLMLLSISAVDIGATTAIRYFVDGFGHIISGGLHPFTKGPANLRLAAEFVINVPVATALAATFATLAAISLAPIPGSNRGLALRVASGTAAQVSPIDIMLQLTSVLLYLAFAGSWTIAFFVVILS